MPYVIRESTQESLPAFSKHTRQFARYVPPEEYDPATDELSPLTEKQLEEAAEQYPDEYSVGKGYVGGEESLAEPPSQPDELEGEMEASWQNAVSFVERADTDVQLQRIADYELGRDEPRTSVMRTLEARAGELGVDLDLEPGDDGE